MQPIRVFDKQGWYLRTRGRSNRVAQGIGTALCHPHCSTSAIREPLAAHLRAHAASRAGDRACGRGRCPRARFRDSIPRDSRHRRRALRVWSFFEYGLFRCFAQAQRETLSDTLGNASASPASIACDTRRRS